MKQWFHDLKIAHKLMLISVFFVLPDSVMLYLFITAINDNIEFATMEAKGNQFQRPLEDLLELIPQHRQLVHRLLGGEAAARTAMLGKVAEIDAAFGRLQKVEERIGSDLQFTDEGLAKRHREHCRVATVKAEWQDLKTRLSRFEFADYGDKHIHLLADIRTMITHAGDTSNLILDPDLDSYYLMDATLLGLPQAQDRLASVIAHGEEVLKDGVLSFEERKQLDVYASLMQEADFDRILGSVQTALNEDPNFYGISPTLQSRVPVLLKEYTTRAVAFIALTKHLAGVEKTDVTPAQFAAAGTSVRDASFQLWRVADQELDTLLQTRVEAYQQRRARSLLVAAGALLAAIGFVTFITRSISGPLRKQAAALQTANDSLQAEIAVREKAETDLRAAEEKYRSIFENSVEGIFQSTADGHYLVANPTLARMYGYESVGELQAAMTDIGACLYVDSERRAEFQRRIAENGTVQQFESQAYRKDGSIIWISEHARAAHDSAGVLLYYEGTVQDITEQKKHEAELEALHRQLMETSRKAGMAEVATGVLHNVGNVLNSVNVSAMLVVDRLSKSRIAHLANVSALLREHAADLGHFLTQDPRGMKLPAFIGSLAERLAAEQTELLRELDALSKNVGHIKEIVSVQQTYAKVSGVIESLPPAELIKDALEMNTAAFNRHCVEVIQEIAEVPRVRVDKHKVLQILINIIRNAKYAVSECSRRDKRIIVRVAMKGPDRVAIAVTDNGIGIAQENLARIFAHGFTTKKDGHGFGLHSAALAATETGGSLSVRSDGPGQGATFELELPVEVKTGAPRTAALAY